MRKETHFSAIVEGIRRFDAYPKTLEDFRVKTVSGAAVTVISGTIMVLLFMSEFLEYLTPQLSEELLVDTSRGETLQINVDVVFNQIPCQHLSLDTQDNSGAHAAGLDTNIFKQRLGLDGKPIAEPEREEVHPPVPQTSVSDVKKETKSTEKPEKCLSCYGAETDDFKCCNTCDDVRAAYHKRGWALKKLDEIEQCKGQVIEASQPFSEGCRVYGYLTVNRVGGSFHIAPGKSYTFEHAHVHNVGPYSIKSFNMTHKIRHLSFGINIPGKTNHLDGTEGHAAESRLIFQYFIKIVPTIYSTAKGDTLYTNQFSATRHVKQYIEGLDQSGMPGVFFEYELSPMLVKYTEKEKSIGHFLTGVCAIIGGVFTIAGLVDAAIYHSSKFIQHKIELGKNT